MKASSSICSLGAAIGLGLVACSSDSGYKDPVTSLDPEADDQYKPDFSLSEQDDFDKTIKSLDDSGRHELAVIFAMQRYGIGGVAKLYEYKGDYNSARKWAELSGDIEYVFRLYRKEISRFIKTRKSVSAFIVASKLENNSPTAISLKEEVLDALEEEEKFFYAGDMALQLGDKKRAYKNYEMAGSGAEEEMKSLANQIASDAFKKNDLKTAAAYLENAGRLGDRSAYSSAAKLQLALDDFRSAELDFTRSREIHWEKENLEAAARSRINCLVEDNKFVQALRIAKEIGDKKKEALIEHCIQLEKIHFQGKLP